MVALPIENSDDYFNLNWFGGLNSLVSTLNGDGNKLHIKQVCRCCGRQYTLLVRPYERNYWERERLEKIFNNLENAYEFSNEPTIVDRLPFFFNWKSDWITFFLSLWVIILVNGLLFIFISIFFITNLDANKQFIIDIVTLTIIQAVFIVIIKRHSSIINQLSNPDGLPYLLHPDYKKSPDFVVFQALIQKGINFIKKIRKVLSFYLIVAMGAFMYEIILKYGVSQIIFWYTSNNLNFSFLLSLFTFFLYFIFIGFTAAYFLLMSVIALTIFTRSIPLKITPLAKDYGIKIYEDFLFYVIVLSIIISVVIPFCINIESVYSIITGIAVSDSKYTSLLTLIQNGNFLYTLFIVISLFSFPVLLVRVTSKNIALRKAEMMSHLGEKISVLKQNKNPSTQELVTLSILYKEYEQTEKIPEYPINKTLLLVTGGLIYLIPILVRLIF